MRTRPRLPNTITKQSGQLWWLLLLLLLLLLYNLHRYTATTLGVMIERLPIEPPSHSREILQAFPLLLLVCLPAPPFLLLLLLRPIRVYRKLR